MKPRTLLSARLLDELAEVLRAGALRASALGRPVTAAHAIDAGAFDSAPELFALAEESGERRFYAAHPREDFELLGLGAARSCALESATAGALRAAVQDWLEPLERHPHAVPGLLTAGPFACCGIAFEPRSAAARGAEWRSFGSAAAWLPELGLERRADRARLHFAIRLDPQPAGEHAQTVTRALARIERLLDGGEPEPSACAARTACAPRAERPHEASYRAALDLAIASIAGAEAQKLVLARAHDLQLPGRLAPAATLRALRERHRDCLTFACGIGAQTFLGATPERLVRRIGERVEAWAVAATAARGRSSGERAELARELRASHKQREEHALVVRGIQDSLAPLCRELDAPAEPSLVETGNVQHLRTRLCGVLREPAHVLELVERIHPTPAVAGTPRSAALEWIRQHEAFDRGWYAGPLGWFDAAGHGDFFVALRCALTGGERARLFAGSGVVAGSSAEEEAAETALKLRSVGEALCSEPEGRFE